MSDLAALLRQLRRDGYSITRTRKGHLSIRDASGRFVMVTGTTPSDHRAMANMRSRLRRCAE